MLRTVSQLLGEALVVAFPRFTDDRGAFAVPYEAKAAADVGLPSRFVQDNHSLSHRAGTIRGIHLQLPPHEQGKLVRVLRGRVVDVVVDLRPDSPTVGRHETIELAGDDELAIWIPPGFGHAFCTLEADSEVFYKVDAPYQPSAELTIAWDDPTLAIDWPVTAADVVLSGKDRHGVSLADALNAIKGSGTDKEDRNT